MIWKQLFSKKSMEALEREMAGEHRLRRVLGPISLTSLGVGAIIGAGIFVMTGRAAAQDAGPAVLLSFVVAGIGCALAALCYAEFASMAPVAGSAYTYAYATLGELFAWIIGWDLILEYAMGCATVAASWSHYFDEFLRALFQLRVLTAVSSDPFSTPGAYINLPAVVIMAIVTAVLVVGIRESATTNTVLVLVKLGVVLFVIGVGWAYVETKNWTAIPTNERLAPEEADIDSLTKAELAKDESLEGAALDERIAELSPRILARYKIEKEQETTHKLQEEGKISAEEAQARVAAARDKYEGKVPRATADQAIAKKVIGKLREEAPEAAVRKWGILGLLGLDRWLVPIDDATRSPFIPYGFSGLMLGAAIVFFAYIGFDSISTHAEEARRPQRDVPIGILASLVLCTVLYIAVAAIITGMEPYPDIDVKSAVAAAFRRRADQEDSRMLRAAAGLIAIGALAGMTSVLLVTFLSQARIFLAMARDRLLPHSIFGAVHPRFKTPHLATMLTGAIICVVAAFTPIVKLEEMVNIGTLMAFIIVCAAVLIMRVRRPDVSRPFRCPAVYVVAPLGILVNLFMTLFLPWDTWLRLVGWLAVGLLIDYFYSHRRSVLGMVERAVEGRRSYQAALEELCTYYQQMRKEYSDLADKIDKQLVTAPGLAGEPPSEQDTLKKAQLRAEYQRLSAEYAELARQAEKELQEYRAAGKPPYALELPMVSASALLHQLKTQGASPTDAPLNTAMQSETRRPQ